MNPAPSPMRPFIPENFNNTLRLFFCCDPFSTLLCEITSWYPLNSDHKRTGVARDKQENFSTLPIREDAERNTCQYWDKAEDSDKEAYGSGPVSNLGHVTRNVHD